jgi:glutamyl-tRNA synthetase
MIVTRFAPSPTGYLHIGGLRTALYSYLWARKNGGKFRLRIEDTDVDRNSEAAKEAILQAFDWVGMEYDDTEVYQSQRTAIYQKYINQLLDEGEAYKCYMSKEELEVMRNRQEQNKEARGYDRTWRPDEGKELPAIPEGITPVIRIKAPTEGVIEFEDGVKGLMSFEASQVDDFVIARANGMPTYNFVVAIDDALMEMSDVIRGDDHLSNTPKQIVIYNALGFEIPKFYHIPMINNPQGKKLSKRDGAMDVMEYQKMGYLPEALLNFLIRLGWSHGDDEIFSKEEMLELFNPNDINKSASAYNQEKLDWLNAHYIKSLPKARIIEELKSRGCDISEHSKSEALIELYSQRANTLIELKEGIESLLNKPKGYDPKSVKKFIKESTFEMLQNYIALLESNSEVVGVDNIENFTKPFINENGYKFPQLFQPIRLSLTGGTVAPSVYDLIDIIGIEETIVRIKEGMAKEFSNVTG